MLFGFGIKHEKKYMRAKKVIEFTGLSRSYIYYLKDTGILKTEMEVIDGEPRCKFETESVIKLVETLVENHEAKIKLEREGKAKAERNLALLRKYANA